MSGNKYLLDTNFIVRPENLMSVVKNIMSGKTPLPVRTSSDFAQRLRKTPRYYLIKGGTRNPERFFYVIQRSPGTGFFANFTYVLHHLKIAENLGMTPVVDFQNFSTLYNEHDAVNGTENAWEYYFEPVSPYTLEEVYASKHIAVSDGFWYLSCMPKYITEDPELIDVFNRYIRIKPEITNLCDDFAEDHFINEHVLGVHFRGQEMRMAGGHPFPPTKKQMLKKINELIALKGFTKVFVSTESLEYLSFLEKNLDATLCFDCYRSNKNSYLESPRSQHRYLLGRDILIDAMLLSKAEALVCGGSMVSEMATFLACWKPDYQYRIDNGMNSDYQIIARYQWFLKSLLPSFLGGFR